MFGEFGYQSVSDGGGSIFIVPEDGPGRDFSGRGIPKSVVDEGYCCSVNLEVNPLEAREGVILVLRRIKNGG